jgi:hypothetical protein
VRRGGSVDVQGDRAGMPAEVGWWGRRGGRCPCDTVDTCSHCVPLSNGANVPIVFLIKCAS